MDDQHKSAPGLMPEAAGNDESTDMAEHEIVEPKAEHEIGPAMKPAAASQSTPPERKHVLHIDQEQGYLELSDAVVATIVRREAAAIGEVVEVRGRNLRNRLWGKLHRRRVVQGIGMQIGRDSITIDLNIAVRYGRNIPQLARDIRKTIIERIEFMTGCNVKAINIIVDHIEQKQPAEPEKP